MVTSVPGGHWVGFAQPRMACLSNHKSRSLRTLRHEALLATLLESSTSVCLTNDTDLSRGQQEQKRELVLAGGQVALVDCEGEGLSVLMATNAASSSSQHQAPGVLRATGCRQLGTRHGDG